MVFVFMDWQKILKVIIAVLSAVLGAVGGAVMF